MHPALKITPVQAVRAHVHGDTHAKKHRCMIAQPAWTAAVAITTAKAESTPLCTVSALVHASANGCDAFATSLATCHCLSPALTRTPSTVADRTSSTTTAAIASTLTVSCANTAPASGPRGTPILRRLSDGLVVVARAAVISRASSPSTSTTTTPKRDSSARLLMISRYCRPVTKSNSCVCDRTSVCWHFLPPSPAMGWDPLVRLRIVPAVGRRVVEPVRRWLQVQTVDGRPVHARRLVEDPVGVGIV
jgi:hypothetical protein